MIDIVGALLIGITLGLLGSGGSTITVPVLKYLVGHGAKESIAESMAIVGAIAVAAAIPYAKWRQIDWLKVWNFGIPGMVGAWVGASLGGMAAETVQLVVFGVVLLSASWFMLRVDVTTNTADLPDAGKWLPLAWLAIQGFVVGVVTGFVGVGGGFLIVPALVIFAKTPVRIAIGTSLAIIAMNSAVGFAKYQRVLRDRESAVDLTTILLFAGIGILGSQIGQRLNARMDQEALRRLFAWVLILLGVFVIVRETTHAFGGIHKANVARYQEERTATGHVKLVRPALARDQDDPAALRPVRGVQAPAQLSLTPALRIPHSIGGMPCC
jgi:uncharacterized protein